MKIIKFNSDTKHRKQWFTGLSFSHPAKMMLPLQLWLIDQFTKEGETILDPMAGSGTLLVACSLGRHVICLELEQKFVDMMKGNWAKIQQRGPQMGYQMGAATIVQGDARDLTGILVDKIITSPPYAEVSPKSNSSKSETSSRGVLINPPNPNEVAIYLKSWRIKRGLTKSQVDKAMDWKTKYSWLEGRPAGIQLTTAKNWLKLKDILGFDNKFDDAMTNIRMAYNSAIEQSGHKNIELPDNPENLGNLPYGSIDAVITSPPYAEGLDASGSQSAEGAISIGDIKAVCRELGIKHASENIEAFRRKMKERKRQYVDAIVTIPPYEEAMGEKHHSPKADKLAEEKSNPVTYTDKVDHIISSPPYEGSLTGANKSGTYNNPEFIEKLSKMPSGDYSTPGRIRALQTHEEGYSTATENIGNLKSTSYLEAMLAVYQQCYSVLKPGGLMVLVVKNFIRNKAIVRLDLDTIRLCEQAGFIFQDRWYRKLTSQSFWRIIYQRKFPDVPVLDTEDILVFRK